MKPEFFYLNRFFCVCIADRGRFHGYDCNCRDQCVPRKYEKPPSGGFVVARDRAGFFPFTAIALAFFRFSQRQSTPVEDDAWSEPDDKPCAENE